MALAEHPSADKGMDQDGSKRQDFSPVAQDDVTDRPKKKRVLVISAHPGPQSFGVALADAYVQQAITDQHQVRVLQLQELQFDPLLHAGYRTPQPLEPDLATAQEAILWAEHLVFVFPVWWGGVPALLKGFLDRVFLPGFAFKYEHGKAFPRQLLRGRSADLLMTLDTPPWYFRLGYGAPVLRQMRKTTLEFCGIRPVRSKLIGPVINSSASRRQKWLREVRAIAARL